jgi:hypothetical protein
MLMKGGTPLVLQDVDHEDAIVETTQGNRGGRSSGAARQGKKTGVCFCGTVTDRKTLNAVLHAACCEN